MPTKDADNRAMASRLRAMFGGTRVDSAQPQTLDQMLWRVLNDPDEAMIDLDREIVDREGLAGFIKLAWPVVERDGTYKNNWHISAVAEHLEAASAGEIKRLVINIPPRHMKSISTSVMWPAWDWIDNPWRQFLYSSYAQDLSTRDAVKSRRILRSPWFQARWGDRFQLTSDQNVKTRYDNNKNGYRMSTSVDSKVTGYGGDFVVADDPHNTRKTESERIRENVILWWDEAMSTRLNDAKSGCFVIIMQRLHENDLVGHVMSKQKGDYTILCLPAEYEPDHPFVYLHDPRKQRGQLLWPEHIDAITLEATKNALGPFAAAGQLQQRPSAREGGYFQRGWFSRTRTPAADTTWVRGWDFAASEEKLVKSDPDYTASVLVGFSPSRRRWIIAHAERFRATPGEVRRRMKQRAEDDRFYYGYHRIIFPQDPGQAGKDQALSLGVLLVEFSCECRPVTGNKVVLATPAAGQAELGNIEILCRGEEDNDWIKEFLDELTGFPMGAHDDQTDAFTTGFNALSGGTTGLLEYYEAQAREKREAQANKPEIIAYQVKKSETTDMGIAGSLSVHHPPAAAPITPLWEYLHYIRNTGANATKEQLFKDFEPLGGSIWPQIMTSGLVRFDHHRKLILTPDGEKEWERGKAAGAGTPDIRPETRS